MATRAKPDGGALPGVVERFVSQAWPRRADAGDPGDRSFATRLRS